MLDRKLFVYSVTGWFLALGVGILIGTVASGPGRWDQDLEGWLGHLEEEVGRLQAEYRALKSSVDERDLVVEALIREAVRDRLTGGRFLARGSLETSLIELLVHAGMEQVLVEEEADLLLTQEDNGTGETRQDPHIEIGEVYLWLTPSPGQPREQFQWADPLERIRLVRSLELLLVEKDRGYRNPK